ncbi:coiled-coil domain-containing protein 83-like [Lingula anatina]|uniref:Coiled-coil domain-containing protein 83-like n=1 Tax=Lingula anatina TaxID=7574 RepID=A0A1S3IE09_LINAN|nr:coiled-coil domain-containing protein 83-like [Lingula anatina]XP_013396468.1 coiled-coil domain-containing protein 83-like [Lingula anatina]XP_013396469.1 coiled-coil domain-containing protein 83-like [Lingula anatina]|eukprot:XP_013396467.1 coiled-coil domain-containing protein 83-like [Lingula anatina]
MGKKGKKGKKSGGGGKKKKEKEPQVTYKEAILAYQISIKEKQMEDYMYELRGLEEKKSRHEDRNDRLKGEQALCIKNLLREAKEFEKQVENQEYTNKEQVVAVMMEKWQTQKEEEKKLEDIREEIKRKDSEIVEVQKDVAYWLSYKDKGHKTDETKIILLEQELKDMEVTITEMSAHLERTLITAKNEIQQYTEETLAHTKSNASEQAIAKMDKNSRQEVLDNNWLKREVDIHDEEAGVLREAVEKLEKENLEIMSELFECRTDDLKISRQFYLTQFQDNENLDDGILEMDLNVLAIEDSAARPKSAVYKSVQDKVLSIMSREELAEEDSDEDLESYEGEGDGSEGDPFETPFDYDDARFDGDDEFLQLGPLELKMLTLKGDKMPIHGRGNLSTEELEAKNFNPDIWPMTTPMLKEVIKDKELAKVEV